MASVESEAIQWHWPDRIAGGKVHLLLGNPGVGKSFFTCWLASMYSRGEAWPDGSGEAPCGSVVFLCSEDGLSDTIRPRLDAHQADCSKVFVIQSTQTNVSESPLSSYDDATPLHLRFDLPLLADFVKKQEDVRLIIIDPITEFLGRSDTNSNAEMRSILSPLAQLAEQTGVAIVCVTHMNKSQQTGQPLLYRALGSIAFTAQARLAYSFERAPTSRKGAGSPGCDDTSGDSVIIRPVKNNLSMEQDGMSYRIVDGAIVWDRFDITNNAPTPDLLAGGADESTTRTWLESLLADGPVEHSSLITQARDLRISRNTLFRVKADLGIISKKGSYATHQGKWFWSLPESATRVPQTNEEEQLPW